MLSPQMIARGITLPDSNKQNQRQKERKPTSSPRRRFIRKNSSTSKALQLSPPRLAIDTKATRSMDILPIHQSKSLLNTYNIFIGSPNHEARRCFKGKKVLPTITRTIESGDLIDLKDRNVSIPSDDSMKKLFHHKSISEYNGNMMYSNFISVSGSILANQITEPL